MYHFQADQSGLVLLGEPGWFLVGHITLGSQTIQDWITWDSSSSLLPLGFNVKVPTGSDKTSLRTNQQFFVFLLFISFYVARCHYFLVLFNRWVAIWMSPPPSKFSYFPSERHFSISVKQKRLIEHSATHNIQTKWSQHFYSWAPSFCSLRSFSSSPQFHRLISTPVSSTQTENLFLLTFVFNPQRHPPPVLQ